MKLSTSITITVLAAIGPKEKLDIETVPIVEERGTATEHIVKEGKAIFDELPDTRAVQGPLGM